MTAKVRVLGNRHLREGKGRRGQEPTEDGRGQQGMGRGKEMFQKSMFHEAGSSEKGSDALERSSPLRVHVVGGITFWV